MSIHMLNNLELLGLRDGARTQIRAFLLTALSTRPWGASPQCAKARAIWPLKTLLFLYFFYEFERR